MRFSLLYFLIFSVCNGYYPFQEPTTEVEVVIKNIRNSKGVFIISFYNDEKSFPKVLKETVVQKVLVSDTLQHKVKVKLPAPGWYAIAMFQDEDENGKIKQDKIGIPLEAYGFSNNIRPEAKAPSFTACKFYAGEANNRPIEINLIQPLFSRKK